MTEAIVVGAGPNGLAAAIELAQAGWSVRLYEARDSVGGGMRSAELTLPGFVHDVCSAIHPMALASPYLSQLPLNDYGLEWIQPDYPLAHPLDDGTAVVMQQDLRATAESLGVDSRSYQALLGPSSQQWSKLAGDILGPFRFPHHPFLFARFGLTALLPTTILAPLIFRSPRARAFFAGNAAHAQMPLENVISASFGQVLMSLGHAVGWPLPKGGAQSIANALAAYFESLGGEIILNHPVEHIDELPKATAVLFDLTPRQVLKIAGGRLPEGYKKSLQGYRYGMGVFKVDYALDGPVPWTAPECHKAGTIHVGGTLEEIAASERAAWKGPASDKPYVLVAQQSLFDPSRAPAGKHTLWAYCHVPHGSTADMNDIIDNQIERFAPGFKDLILARSSMNADQMQAYNANYIGGDINGGVQDLLQLWTRPTISLNPYAMPAEGLYFCSSSTPPGGGVHGMCGFHAAQAVLRKHSDKS